MTNHDYLQAMGIDVWQEKNLPTSDNDPWQQLQSDIEQCTACELHRSRQQVVFGTGNPQADILFVGEAPGAQEDQQGKPFVGRAGQLLTNMLKAIGLQREDVFITNILKCRPPNNRNPQVQEIATCTPFLAKQIALIQPKLTVALGRVAAHHLLATDAPLGKMREQQYTYGDTNIPLLVTYHPAYLLRSPLDKRKAWQDLLRIKRTVGEK